MAPRATILGGHRDGEVLDLQGSDLLAPLPRNARYVERDAATGLKAPMLRVERFKARQDLDGRWFYVLQPRQPAAR